MSWLLLYVAIVLGGVAPLGVTALRLRRKVVTVRTAAAQLKDRAVTLGEQTTALSERLDVAEVMAKVAQRTG